MREDQQSITTMPRCRALVSSSPIRSSDSAPERTRNDDPAGLYFTDPSGPRRSPLIRILDPMPAPQVTQSE
jgi:hypothetical protein